MSRCRVSKFFVRACPIYTGYIRALHFNLAPALKRRKTMAPYWCPLPLDQVLDHSAIKICEGVENRTENEKMDLSTEDLEPIPLRKSFFSGIWWSGEELIRHASHVDGCLNLRHADFICSNLRRDFLKRGWNFTVLFPGSTVSEYYRDENGFSDEYLTMPMLKFFPETSYMTHILNVFTIPRNHSERLSSGNNYHLLRINKRAA